MKKITILLLVICMVISFAACGGNTSGNTGSSSLKFDETYKLNDRTFYMPEGFVRSGEGQYDNNETNTHIIVMNIDMGLETYMLDDLDEENFNTFANSLLSSLEEQLGAESVGNAKKVSPANMKGLVSEATVSGLSVKICALLDPDNYGWYAFIIAAEDEDDIYYRNFEKILDKIE